MNKTQELIKILNENPDREIIFMYPNEKSDLSCTLGYPKRILVDEYWIDDDCVWLKYDDEDEIKDHYDELIAYDMFTKFPLTDEEEKIVDDKLVEFINTRNWKKCICVFINY